MLINGTVRDVAPPWAGESLLVVLREHLGLVGTKCGCGEGSCGACTILIDHVPARSCRLKVEDVVGRSLTTIEGLSGPDGTLHPLQQSWIEEAVAQCGFCQPGQIMQALALLLSNPTPTRREIVERMDGHLCRCGSQGRVIRAVGRAATAMQDRRGAT